MKRIIIALAALSIVSLSGSAAEGADFSLRMRAGNQISGDKQGCQALYGFSGEDLRVGPCVDIALFKHAYFRTGALFTANYPHVEKTILGEGETLFLGYVSPYLEVCYMGELASIGRARLGCHLGFSFFTSPVAVTEDPIFEILFVMLGFPMSSLKLSCGLTLSM